MKIKSSTRVKTLLIFAITTLGISSFIPGIKPIQTISKAISSIAKLDTLIKVTLPEGIDPNDEVWKGIDISPKNPVKSLSPEEEAKMLLLPPGYKLTPILTEPAIENPAEITFDGNGAMYVLELRSYMIDADSKNELDPINRISRWEDKNNDGVYESGTIFVDNLIFPRFVLPYGKNCILTMESDADNVYKYTDTNGDGKADKKELFSTKYGRSGNVEHQQAFLYYGMDNWLYSTVNSFRIRETPGGIIREKTGYNRAQWGATQDNDGKMWFQGGASGVPSYFQFPIHYGNFEVPNQFEKGFYIPYGEAMHLADVQGGMTQVKQPDGSLSRVTGSAGNDIFRGHRLPDALKGQLFYGEPVARIVRQINPENKEGLTVLSNVYQKNESEFIRSKDPLFRPIDMATAPDGTMYIVDMYHGIIQEGNWTAKGSYLRTKIDQFQMAKVTGFGRIWRLTYEGLERDKKQPNMLNESSSTLVGHLSHPNGWWRDMAQQLIVLRKDVSVGPALITLAKNSKNELARIHALWTLEGLGILKADLVQNLSKDSNPRMRIHAMRAGETLYKAGEKSLGMMYQTLLKDSNTDVCIQAMLSGKVLQLPDLDAQLKTAMTTHSAEGVKLVATQIITPIKMRNAAPVAEFSKEQKAILERGELVFSELCSQCHGNNGQGKPEGNGKFFAPALAGSLRLQGHPSYAIQVLLHGLEGPIQKKTFSGGMMAPMKEQSDEWISDVLSYIRTGMSNEASFVTPQQVSEVRSRTKKQNGLYKFDPLYTMVPQELGVQDNWEVKASHISNNRIGSKGSPKTAFTYEGWSTGEKQAKGMWYEVKFPKEIMLSELQFNAQTMTPRGYKPIPNVPNPSVSTHPRKFTIETSLDGQTWQVAKTHVSGNEGNNQIAFSNTKTKYMRIVLDEPASASGDDIPWMIKQMKVFGIQ